MCYATEGGRRVRWNAYAMELGRVVVDSVGLPLIGTIEENEVRMSNHDRLDGSTHRIGAVEYMPNKPGTYFGRLFMTVVRASWW